MMRIQPVRRKSPPRYPTREYLFAHPELLAIVPERWRRNRFVLKVLGAAACLVLSIQNEACAQQKGRAASAARIAPLFPHGEGRGSFGCLATNPPVFLSEDEARQVIQDEAKKSGIEFVADAFTVAKVTVPLTDPYWCPPQVKRPGPAVQRRDVVLDGFDREHQVGYEFVSRQDFTAWERKDPACRSTVASYDMKGIAEALRAGLEAAAPEPRIGVFYESGAMPAASREHSWEQRREEGRRLGANELREQVRDFIRWLKAQGVI